MPPHCFIVVRKALALLLSTLNAVRQAERT